MRKAQTMTRPAQHVLPRWRGFNLLDAFRVGTPGDFSEDDFRWIAEWGLDFVRLPMSYEHWASEDDRLSLNERFLEEKLDPVVALGERYGVHVCFNFHRAPGYTVNKSITEPDSLWKDAAPLEAFCAQWRMFARRYKGVPSERVSFDLVNEPPGEGERMTRDDHQRVVRAAVAAIREVDPGRLVIADGISWGNHVCPELSDLGIAQSCRAYRPMQVSHYKASWVNSSGWPEPRWPITAGGQEWNRDALVEHYRPWVDLARSGVGVHCGEGGAFKHTPHDVVLRWFADVLDILKGANIGFALWNLRGPFGVLDSGRADVKYESWHGHELDRALLELLRSH
jgi:endoglucanase